MRVAMLTRPQEHYSLLLYRNAMTERLPAFGIELHEFTPDEQIPDNCDIVWDPGLGMRHVPAVLFGSRIPIIVTVLGLRSFGASIHDLASGESEIAWETEFKREIKLDWQRLQPMLAAAITISRSCGNDLISSLGVPADLVHPIYLAINRGSFMPRLPIGPVPRNYMLHVSLGGSARKNITRILTAYTRLPAHGRLALLIKHQGQMPDIALPKGVQILPGHCSEEELAGYYLGARCLVFPSIYEGFGLPILEAMSSGCPVITANSTACAEIATDATLLVDPLSVDAIANAMHTLLQDDDLALDLAKKGLRRAGDFDWDMTATQHAELFRAIARH